MTDGEIKALAEARVVYTHHMWVAQEAPLNRAFWTTRKEAVEENMKQLSKRDGK